MRDHLELESGLEHDLLRSLDRLAQIIKLVPQPCQLTGTGSTRVRNTPDLLSLDDRGNATLWNARPEHKIDEEFKRQVDMVGAACEEVGWRHEVFTGLGRTERLNLLWLHGYRRKPSWYDQVAGEIRASAAQAAATLGSVFRLDSGNGEIVAAVWYMVWSAELVVDLSQQLTVETPVTGRES